MKKELLVDKWSDNSLVMGWTAIPNALFFMQRPLELSPINFNVLLNLFSHWWETDAWPYPSQKGLASRMGVSVRTVQRSLDELVEKKLILRKSTMRNHPKYKGRNVYDLSPIIKLVSTMAPQLKQTIGKKDSYQSKNEYL